MPILNKKLIFCVLLLLSASLHAETQIFTLEALQDVEVGNDETILPTAINAIGNAMSMRNISTRRRVSFVKYDIAGLKSTNPEIKFQNIRFNLLAPLRSNISVWGIPEALDDLNLHALSYATAPGIVWDMATPLDSSVVLDNTELTSELLFIGAADITVDVRTDTVSSSSLDDFFNADTDGTVVLMFSGSNAIVRSTEYHVDGYGDPPLNGIVLRGELSIPESDFPPRYMEALDRGLVGIFKGSNAVYLGWRMKGDDPADIAFNLYRNATKLNTVPITQSTNWLDTGVPVNQTNQYRLRAVIDGIEQADEAMFLLEANPTVPIDQPDPYGFNLPHLTIPLQSIPSADRVGIGDLDGDGCYDYVVKWPAGISDPGKHVPAAETFKLDAYRSDGTFLWRIDLGWNIEQGIWWSPMLVYDLDSDGKAEVIAKSAPNDVDYRNEDGWVLTGPEWFSIWDGQTGAELATADWIPRGDICDWGDCYGNRANRHMMCIAYLDGVKPSLVIFRGTYGLMKAQAWNFRNGKLTKLWDWSNEGLGAEFQGMGFHQIRVGDVDGDGRDEILNGCILIDDDGTTRYSTGEGHGDRFHLTDIDPSRPGLETFYVHEGGYTHAIDLRDARTGQLLWGHGDSSWGDVGRGLVADIDPTHPGLECWSSHLGLWNSQGELIDADGPRNADSFVCDMAIWWDDDLTREINQGVRLLKWDWAAQTTYRFGTANGIMAVADVIGDWREEIISIQNGQLRINTPITTSSRRFYTLMHDPIYRIDVSSMSVGYRVPAHPSFYLGENMAPAPIPNIRLTDGVDSVSDRGFILREWWTGLSGTAVSDLTSSPDYPAQPTGRHYLTKFEGPVNWANDYGTRISGYLYPPESGTYIFWIAGDDNGELRLSTDALASHAVLIASVPGYTGFQQWEKYPQQQSVPVYLEAGHKYYIEVLHKEGSGGDNISVAWQGPDFDRTIIDGRDLSPRFDFIPGDLNDSGTVNLNDLDILVRSWLAYDCTFSVILDLNGDCRIDFSDFQQLAQSWLLE